MRFAYILYAGMHAIATGIFYTSTKIISHKSVANDMTISYQYFFYGSKNIYPIIYVDMDYVNLCNWNEKIIDLVQVNHCMPNRYVNLYLIIWMDIVLQNMLTGILSPDFYNVKIP